MIVVVVAAVLSQAFTSAAEMHEVTDFLDRLVSHHLSGCHLLFLSTTPDSPVSTVVRSQVSTQLYLGSISKADLPEVLSRDTKVTCHGLIFHLDVSQARKEKVKTEKRENNTEGTAMDTLRVLEQVQLWRLPQARVVEVGEARSGRAVLLHHSFRNTIHGIYLAMHRRPAATSTRRPLINTAARHVQEIKRVSVYRRCMYCRGGREGVLLVTREHVHRLPFLDVHAIFDDEQFLDMGGHEFRMVGLRHFPYMDYVTASEEPGSAITLRDSLDARLIATLSATLNFTFSSHEQREWEWGFPTEGKFNGMMGELQREEVDLCTVSAPVAERIGVVGFLRGYPSDRLVIASLKPTFLPENLALVRPFEVEVWAALVGSLVVWGSTLWLLGKAWGWFAYSHTQRFSKAFLYVWGALLEQPPRLPSFSITEKVLMGLWLVFCLVLTTGYKSALMSHLTVKSKSDTIETFKDLVELQDWRWGAERWSLVGAPTRYLSLHTDPVVQHVYKGMEIYETIDETLVKVLAGGFSFISFRNYVTVAVASKFAGTIESSPFYVSKQGVSIMAVFGWHTRYGAPFQYRFSKILDRLQDVGITARWQKEVIARRIQENRAASAKSPSTEYTGSRGVQEKQTGGPQQEVLGLAHLQGAFYLMFLGVGLACLALLAETVA